MPNLGPFGEALGRAIAPALKAASGKADKFLEKSMQERVYPTIGKLVEEITGGGSAYTPPRAPIGTSRWRKDLAYADRNLNYIKESLDQQYDKRKELLNDPRGTSNYDVLQQLETNQSRIDSVTMRRDTAEQTRNESLAGRVQRVLPDERPTDAPDYFAAREYDPSNPATIPAVVHRMISPLNEPEVRKNVAVFANTARLLRKATPKPLLEMLPASAQGLIHWVTGKGEPTDMGLSWDKVKNIPQKIMGNIEYAEPVEQMNPDFYNTAAKLLEHGQLPDIRLSRLKPIVFTRGPLTNAVGKAFVVQRPDGGWDLIDDYRFYDHTEPYPRPSSRDTAVEHSIRQAEEYKKLQNFPKERLRKLVDVPLVKILRQINGWGLVHLKNHPKIQYKVKELFDSFNSTAGYAPSELSFHTDKMLMRHGQPFLVHIRDIDKVIAASKANASSGKPFDLALEYTRGQLGGIKPLSEVVPLHPGGDRDWAAKMMNIYWNGHSMAEHVPSIHGQDNVLYHVQKSASPFIKAVIDERLKTEGEHFRNELRYVLTNYLNNPPEAQRLLLRGFDRDKATDFMIKHWADPIDTYVSIEGMDGEGTFAKYLTNLCEKLGIRKNG